MPSTTAQAGAIARETGSHRHYVHATKPGVVTVPGRLSRDLPMGTERSILKEAQQEAAASTYAIIIASG